jgi:hypothetical protein
MSDLAQTINYMATAIDMITKNMPSSSRQISQFNRTDLNHGNNRGQVNRGIGRTPQGNQDYNIGTGRGRGNRG